MNDINLVSFLEKDEPHMVSLIYAVLDKKEIEVLQHGDWKDMQYIGLHNSLLRVCLHSKILRVKVL